MHQNGWSSGFFTLSRGVRQGCPLSPYLFILCAEILGNAVRNDPKVRGIKVLDTECKISQYADDTTSLTAHNHHSPGLFICWTHSLQFRDLELTTTKQRPFGLVRIKVHTLPFPWENIYYGLKKRFTL